MLGKPLKMRFVNSAMANMGKNSDTGSPLKSWACSRVPLAARLDASAVLFYCAFGIWLATSVLYTSFFACYLKVGTVRVACCGMLIVSEVLSNRVDSKYAFGWCAIYLAIIMILSNQTASPLLDGILFIFRARDYSFKEIATFSFAVISFCFAIIVISARLGIITNYVEENEVRTRAYLGFRYSLYSSRFAFTLTALFIAIRDKKIRIFESAILFLFNLALFLLTNSRLSFVLSTLLIIAALIVKHGSGRLLKHKLVGLILSSCFIAALLFSITMTVSYDSSNQIMEVLDSSKYLGGRLTMGKDALYRFGISAFGQELPIVGNGLGLSGEHVSDAPYFYLDCLYIALPVRFGVLFTIGIIAIMTRVVWESWKRQDFFLVAILVIIAGYSIIDDSLLWLYYNPFFFLAGGLLSNHTSAQAGVFSNKRRFTTLKYK